jgi:hypothetical protein
MRVDTRSLLLTAVMSASGLTVVVVSPPSASAWPEILLEWQSLYPGSQSDEIAGCTLCHVNPTGQEPWNPYGWEIRRRMNAGLSAHDAILEAEQWDSDDNPRSWSNRVEIDAHTQPGWTDGLDNVEHYADGSRFFGIFPDSGILGSMNPTASPMIPMCDPGEGMVVTCPCANPARGQNRGCNNSSLTSGAALTARGVASLSADTVVFTTGGEKPTALSVLGQWTQPRVSPGHVFGQGLRCAVGSLKRLYSANAVGGSITVPTGSQPSVSAQSALKGDTILPGESRAYIVYYRDNVVPGVCSPLSNYNSTQTGKIVWEP